MLPFHFISTISLTFSFRAPDEKDQLIRQHHEALSAQKAISKELKDQLIQLGLKHNEEMKAALAGAEAKLNETLEDANNSNVVLQAELEEAAKARKAAEDKAAWLEAEQKEYDLLVTQTDALSLRKFLFSLFRFLLISLSLSVAFA